MSYLNGPRINFWGGASADVSTANNEGHDIFDLVNELVVDSRSDEEIIRALREPATNRRSEPYYTKAGWNYYGDHQFAFVGARVSSAGRPGLIDTQGDLIGLPVYLLGSVDPDTGEGPYGGPVMVDVDPASSQATQIYVGGLQIGDGDRPVLLVRGNARCHSHFLGNRFDPATTKPPHLTPGSVYGSGTFQLAFPRSAVVQWDSSRRILGEILDYPGSIGIVVRFTLFEFMPGMSTPELLANYAANYNDRNPSLGRVIGTIGPWLPGEPATIPPGRLLRNDNLENAQGLAWLDPVERRLTLDLSSTLQAQKIRSNAKDITSPIGPNVDYGDLLIRAKGYGGVLASVPSLPDTYYLYGGIYDVPLSSEAVQLLMDDRVVIESTKNGLSITESPIRIYGDWRNVYLDDFRGEKAWVELQIRELGGPIRGPAVVALETGQSGSLENPGFLCHPKEIPVNVGQTVLRFTIQDNGGKPGFLALNFRVVTGGDRGEDDEPPDYFVNFRKYPADTYRELIDNPPIPWEKVYEICLRFSYLMFPAMSKRIPLNDRATINAVASEILKRLSPRYRETTLAMPITRGMSPGKIELLSAYLQGVLKEVGKEPMVPAGPMQLTSEEGEG